MGRSCMDVLNMYIFDKIYPNKDIRFRCTILVYRHSLKIGNST